MNPHWWSLDFVFLLYLPQRCKVSLMRNWFSLHSFFLCLYFLFQINFLLSSSFIPELIRECPTRWLYTGSLVQLVVCKTQRAEDAPEASNVCVGGALPALFSVFGSSVWPCLLQGELQKQQSGTQRWPEPAREQSGSLEKPSLFPNPPAILHIMQLRAWNGPNWFQCITAQRVHQRAGDFQWGRLLHCSPTEPRAKHHR